MPDKRDFYATPDDTSYTRDPSPCSGSPGSFVSAHNSHRESFGFGLPKGVQADFDCLDFDANMLQTFCH